MVLIPMRWGHRTALLEAPPDAAVLSPSTPAPLTDFDAALDLALSAPVARPPLEEALRGADRVTILVPDKTRHAQTPRVLARLLNRLDAAGIGGGGVRVLVAAGDHPAHSPKELLDVVGPDAAARVRVEEHRASDEDACVEVGRTSRGTPVRLDRRAVDGAALVLTGAASHHYFAGFGGGPKALFPGAAARSSIRANHSLVIANGDKDPRTTTGKLDGNPLHEDICEAVAMVDPAFCVNVVNDGDDRPLAVFAGCWRLAHREACAYLDRVASLPPTSPVDLLAVSAGGHPHDLNLVQSHKAMDRCAPLVRDGGTMLLIARCEQGYGDPDLESWMLSGDERRLLDAIARDFRVKAHTALCLMRKARRLRIHVAAPLGPAPALAAGLALESDPAAAWRMLLGAAAAGARVALVPAGHFAVPAIRP